MDELQFEIGNKAEKLYFMDLFVDELMNEQKTELRIIIAGSRDFNDYEYLKKQLSKFIKDHPDKRFTIVSGVARGADQLGEKYAREKCIQLKRFPADWNNLGRSAGYIRNTQMLDYIKQNDCEGYVLAFWDGQSKGTRHMIKTAKKAGVPVEIFQYPKTEKII